MNEKSAEEKMAADNIARLRAKEKNDLIASFLEMRLLKLSPGHAKVAIKLKREYQNSTGLIFGGIIMAVADQAFAYASNSATSHSVASQFNIHFIAGAEVTDELIAEGRVIKSGRRVGISEMVITNRDGKLIAKATGTTIPVAQPESSTHAKDG